MRRSIAALAILGGLYGAPALAAECARCATTSECKESDPRAFCVRYLVCGDLGACCDGLDPGPAQDACFPVVESGDEASCANALALLVQNGSCTSRRPPCGSEPYCCPAEGCAVPTEGELKDYPDCFPATCELLLRAPPDAGMASDDAEVADAAAPADAGSAPDLGAADAGTGGEEGCGCATTRVTPTWTAALALLLVTRRRR